MVVGANRSLLALDVPLQNVGGTLHRYRVVVLHERVRLLLLLLPVQLDRVSQHYMLRLDLATDPQALRKRGVHQFLLQLRRHSSWRRRPLLLFLQLLGQGGGFDRQGLDGHGDCEDLRRREFEGKGGEDVDGRLFVDCFELDDEKGISDFSEAKNVSPVLDGRHVPILQFSLVVGVVWLAIVALATGGSYLGIALLLLLAGNCGQIALVDLAEDHVALTAVLLLVAALAGEALLAEDAEFEEFAVAGLEDVVVVDGEEIGSGGRHVDLVVVCLR